MVIADRVTLFSLTKNLAYKNNEAQMRQKIRTIMRTSCLKKGECKNFHTKNVLEIGVIKKNCGSETV